MVKLGEIFTISRGGSPRPIQDYITDSCHGVNWIMIGDTEPNSKYIRHTAKKIKFEGVKKSRKVYPGDLLLTNSMSFGRPYILDVEGCIHDGWLVLSPKNNQIHIDYFYHYLNSPAAKIIISNKAAGAVVKNLNSDIVRNLEIPFPPFAEQVRIASTLDKVDGIRQKRDQAIKLADDFLRATFLAMFGDSVENPKRWDVASLLEYGSFKNGMNFTKGESGSVLKCLGVGNFKSLATITCMDNIGEIELNTLPSDDYLLKDGDIVFVRSNGNKALVGRCLTIYPGKEKVTFSGFCIRYRIENTAITPEYLNFLFRTPSMKQQMLSGGQGANIQNISQGTLSALRIPVPPLEKQQAFSKVVSFHSALMEKLDINTVEIEDMFDSISQQYFN
ncbi:restriction endonuclease subunit S [Escherichia coli O22]|nr:restriction endonuclease subunit S [Escherichia coli O22]